MSSTETGLIRVEGAILEGMSAAAVTLGYKGVVTDYDQKAIIFEKDFADNAPVQFVFLLGRVDEDGEVVLEY